jgi:hypothetical protein
MLAHSRHSLHFHSSSHVAIHGQVVALTLAALLSGAPPVAAEERPERQASNPDHAASVLDGFAEAAHRARLLTGYTVLGLGVTATGIGLIADLEYDKSYGSTLWIAGAGGIVGSVLGLLGSSAIERFAEDHGAGAPGYSPEGLEAAWRARIESERSKRKTVSIIGMGIGAAFLGASGALLAGVGDMDRSERGRLVVTTGLLGGANLSGGLVTLLIESDLERAFERAYGTGDVSSVGIHVGVAPVGGGGALQMGGTF